MRLSFRAVLVLSLLLLITPACSRREEKKARVDPWDEPTGEALFRERCRDCHKVNRSGGEAGPDLSRVGKQRSAKFFEQVIREPDKVFPGTVMPLYDTLSVRQVNSLVVYLTALQGPAK